MGCEARVKPNVTRKKNGTLHWVPFLVVDREMYF